MDIISLEMDSMTPKTPDNMYHTKCFMKNIKTSKMYDVILQPFWNFAALPIKKVAYGCQSGK